MRIPAACLYLPPRLPACYRAPAVNAPPACNPYWRDGSDDMVCLPHLQRRGEVAAISLIAVVGPP